MKRTNLKTKKRICHAHLAEFFERYEGKTVHEILEAEASKAAATVAHIRDHGTNERNRLRACEIILSKVVPDRIYSENVWKDHEGKIFYPYPESEKQDEVQE